MTQDASVDGEGAAHRDDATQRPDPDPHETVPRREGIAAAPAGASDETSTDDEGAESLDTRRVAGTQRGRGLRSAALLGVLLGLPFVLFLALAEDVAEEEVFAWDSSILRWAAHVRTPTLNDIMRLITDLGATVTLTVAALALTALLLRRRLHREALFLVLSVGLAALLNALLKQLFQRPRPDVVAQVVAARGFAFPSGHTMSSMALACALVLLAWRLRLPSRWSIAAAAFAFAFLVGASRVYLGVHYPSDVLAGWLVSLDLVAVVYLLLFHLRPSRQPGETVQPPRETASSGPHEDKGAGQPID